MRNTFLFLAAVCALALGTAVLDSPAAAPTGGGDDPQAPPPPQAVSPADPKAVPPDAGCWVCPRCGAQCQGPAWRHKGQLDRPQLAPGGEFRPGRGWGSDYRPGRYGREGDRPARAAMGARSHRHGIGRAGLAGPGHGGGFAAEMLIRRAEDLKLTEDQIGKLETIAYEAKRKLVDLHAEIEKSEIEIQALLGSDSEDMTGIRQHLGAASRARAEIQETRIASLFEARKVLTAEQKKMLKAEFPRLGRIID